MPKPKKKVVVKKLVGLDRDALEALNTQSKETGWTQTQVIHHALLGDGVFGEFNPFVEAGLKEYQREHKCSRKRAVEALLSEAIAVVSRMRGA